jgi:hypothetical protein
LTKKLFFLACLFLLILVCSSPARANTKQELAIWNYVDFYIPLDFVNKKLTLLQSLGPRMNRNVTQMETVFGRSEFRYGVNRNIAVSLGYDWFRRFNNDNLNYENRIWQQILISKKITRKDLIYTRNRIEQRFYDTDGFGSRFRTRLGWFHYFTRTLYVELSNEMHFSYDSSSGGLSQNRFIAAIYKQWNDFFTLYLGYQLQHFLPDAGLVQHGIITRFMFHFDEYHKLPDPYELYKKSKRANR